MPIDLEIDRFCIGCGYNIRGIVSDRCPECGLKVGGVDESSVPWEGRKRLGLRQAFERTVWMGMFQTRRLAAARSFPVDGRSARTFRLIVSLLAALPPAILLWIAIAVSGGTGFLNIWRVAQSSWPPPPSPYMGFWEMIVLWSAGPTHTTTLPIGFFLTLFLASGMPRLWVRGGSRDRELQNRSADLSAYLSSSLLALVIPTIAAAVIWQVYDPNSSRLWWFVSGAIFVGTLSLVVIVLQYAVSSAQFIREVTHVGWDGLMLRIAGLAASWATALVIGMVLFPLLAGLIWLMIESLRA
jgi:hypothetical protein